MLSPLVRCHHQVFFYLHAISRKFILVFEYLLAGTFTKNVVAAAPVVFCKQALAQSTTVSSTFISSFEVAVVVSAIASKHVLLISGSSNSDQCRSSQCCHGKECDCSDYAGFSYFISFMLSVRASEGFCFICLTWRK